MWLEWQDHQEAPVSKPEVSEDDIQANDSSEVTQQIATIENTDLENQPPNMDQMMAALEEWAVIGDRTIDWHNQTADNTTYKTVQRNWRKLHYADTWERLDIQTTGSATAVGSFSWRRVWEALWVIDKHRPIKKPKKQRMSYEEMNRNIQG